MSNTISQSGPSDIIHIRSGRLMRHPGMDLLYLDFEVVLMKPAAVSATPVETTAEEAVKGEQWTVGITAGVAEMIETVGKASRP
jgi:hypothetical protein